MHDLLDVLEEQQAHVLYTFGQLEGTTAMQRSLALHRVSDAILIYVGLERDFVVPLLAGALAESSANAQAALLHGLGRLLVARPSQVHSRALELKVQFQRYVEQEHQQEFLDVREHTNVRERGCLGDMVENAILERSP